MCWGGEDSAQGGVPQFSTGSNLYTCTPASKQLIKLCVAEGVVGTVEEAEKEKGSIWRGSVWEVKDRNGVYILYRGEFAMSRGVIISAKQTR